jgi:hypothetical protein
VSANDVARAWSWRPAAAGLLALHALASARFPWEEESFLAALLRPNPDLVLLLAVGFALVLRFGERRVVSHGVALGLLFVALYRFGATVMPVFYGKDLDPYNDVLMAPSLVHLLLHRYPAWLQVVLSLTVIGAVTGLYLLFHAVVRVVVRAGTRRAWCFGFVGVGQALVLAGWMYASAAPAKGALPWSDGMLAPAVADGIDAVRQWRAEADYAEALAAAEAEHATLPRNLDGLEGADVYVMFVESYGMALFRKPETAATFEAWTPAWLDGLGESGFGVLSALTRPAVSGGASSLAHAQFMSGVEVASRRHFDSLLVSRLEPLPRTFRDAGYRALNVQPATNAEWPEGKWFGFTEDVFSAAFPYEGHAYHWGYMPDQFALAHLLKTEVRDATDPLFVQYVSVTSHAPFSMIPPYVADWEAAADSASFASGPARSFPIHWLNYATHPEVGAAYLDSVRYSLETLVGFTRQLTRPSLVLILGDHQAPRVGDLRSFDGSFDVPVHVIANREHLLSPFVATGFAEGFVPPADFASHSTTEFLAFFRNVFGR